MTPADHPPASEPDDHACMLAYARGDSAAFERLYTRHHQALYRFVRRLLGPALALQADEVFQDTWLKVIDARQRYAPQGASFRTWLFTLAHHRAVDCLRKTGRELPLDDLPPFVPAVAEGSAAWAAWPEPAAEAPGPAEQAFWHAAGARLLHCLDQLPVVQRTAFLLHHDEGLSLPELAQSLGLGFETAKSRLRYAMDKLRVCMGAYLPEAPSWEPRT
jgi:RNA polymerase sigma factor (sigma-70 family)